MANKLVVVAADAVTAWIIIFPDIRVYDIVLIEIVRYFNETLQNDASISEAVAAIQTLLEVIPRSNGELETVDEQIRELSILAVISVVTIIWRSYAI